MEHRWATKTQAAEYAGCSRRTIWRWAKEGSIRQSQKRDGMRQLVDLRSIDEYLGGGDGEER